MTLFFVVLGSRIGSNFNNELIGAILGLLIGVGVSRFINKMDGTRKYKVRFAWGVAITGFFLYLVMFGFTASEHYTPTSSNPPSSPNERLSSNPSPPPSRLILDGIDTRTGKPAEKQNKYIPVDYDPFSTPSTPQKSEGTSKGEWVDVDYDPFGGASEEKLSPPNPHPVMDGREAEKIGSLFENIRQANLQKNIDLFMSCFSRDFNGTEEKRKDTLKMWENFNYHDLSYELKKQTISGDTADVRLEWLVRTSEKVGGNPRDGKIVLDVTLKREDGYWKIKEIKPVS